MSLSPTFMLSVLVWAALSTACGPAPAPDTEADASSRRAGSPRLVSLAPHLTELAFDAGAGGQLIGVVAYSDYPPAARDIARIGDAFNLDYERIAELSPDVVLTWEGGTPPTALERLKKMGFEVVPLSTLRLDDVAEAVIRIGQIAGDPEAALEAAAAYRAALGEVRRVYGDRERIRVFYQVSLEPLYTPGGPHFISELIALCGGLNIFSDLDLQAAAVSHEAVLARNPQLIIVGQQWLSETIEHWRRFSSASPRVTGIDADVVTRPGLRLARGASAICAEIDGVRAARAKNAEVASPYYGHASTALPGRGRHAPARVLPRKADLTSG